MTWFSSLINSYIYLTISSDIIASSHSLSEWESDTQFRVKVHHTYSDTTDMSAKRPMQVFTSFGIHPQNPDRAQLAVLEKLLQSGDPPTAIGEIGFDLFDAAYKKTECEQDEVWRACLDLALSYNKPVLIHIRKAMHKMFPFVSTLKRLPAVIFHSYPGSPIEAESILKKGVNAFFSFGKTILQGHKSAIASLKQLPVEHILLETDAPYQTLQGETETKLTDIARVYNQAVEIRGLSVEVLAEQVEQNFKRALQIQTNLF